MKKISIPIPPIDEQFKIGKELDKKIKEIDNVIEKTRQTIEDYKLYKQSIITKAVTKGLDKNKKLKEVNIDWSGTIPEKWNVTSTLNVLSMPITDGPHTTPELFDHGIPFVSAEAISTGKGKINFSHIRGYISNDFYNECCKKYIPKLNDIYMIKSGATTGKVSIVDTDKIFNIWSPLAVFRCNVNRMKPLFLFYALQSEYYQKQVENKWTYGTQQNIGMRVLEKLKIIIPPITEQDKIIKYLNKNVLK
ncbi:MAG: restriction endonuclease subunit S [Clostridia bacterium]